MYAAELGSKRMCKMSNIDMMAQTGRAARGLGKNLTEGHGARSRLLKEEMHEDERDDNDHS
jgi:hypothetical protein